MKKKESLKIKNITIHILPSELINNIFNSLG